MKFLFLILFFCLTCTVGYCQNSVHVKGKGYDGYIFNKDYDIFGTIEDQQSRYTPTIADIQNVERILKDSINYIRANQVICYKCPVIHKNLRKYKRQYVGYLNQKDEVIIWINFLKDHEESSELAEEVVFMLDGGSYYWSIYINLNKKELFNMKVNGIS